MGGTATKTFTYDSAGRTTAITSGGVSTNLTYDYESRVTQISRTGSTTNTFSYNGLDTRVSKVDSGGTSTYKRAGAGVTAPVLADGFATFTPGVSERRSSTTTYAHSGLKNMEARSGSSQTVTADRQYDAFGQVVSSTGTWNGPFGYAGAFGYQEDGDYGLKLLGHRYYDPSTGRFLTRDPIKDGRNWYGYCENNPIALVDEDGQQASRIIKQILDKLFRRGGKPKYGRGESGSAPPPLPPRSGLKGRPGSALPPNVGAGKVPPEWGKGGPTRKGGGVRWRDPKAPDSNIIRIDPGNPGSPFPSQQVDHVIITHGGKVIGRDGKPIRGSISEDPVNAHIPLSEWKKWRHWWHP